MEVKALMVGTLKISDAFAKVHVTYMPGEDIVQGVGLSSAYPHTGAPFITLFPISLYSYEIRNLNLHIRY